MEVLWAVDTRGYGKFYFGQLDISGKAAGFGRYIGSDGNFVSEGQWKNNTLHGYGRQIWYDGTVKEGKFEDNGKQFSDKVS